jgi:hypothetical protein
MDFATSGRRPLRARRQPLPEEEAFVVGRPVEFAEDLIAKLR